MNEITIILAITCFFLMDTILIITVLWFFFRMMGKLVMNSGFPRLFQIWPADMKPQGICFYRQYIALDDMWFKNAANLIIGDEGLYLSFGFPISLSIPQAVLIPWKQIRFQNKHRAFWTEVYDYQIVSEKPVILTIMKRVARSFPEHLQPENQNS